MHRRLKIKAQRDGQNALFRKLPGYSMIIFDADGNCARFHWQGKSATLNSAEYSTTICGKHENSRFFLQETTAIYDWICAPH
jgi:hypothetical protein